MDYSLRTAPTRITPWPGNMSTVAPDNNNYKDPYEKTPLEYLNDKDKRYLLTNKRIDPSEAGNLTRDFTKRQLLATFPDGHIELYDSAEEYSRIHRHNSSNVRRHAKEKKVIRSTGVKVEYLEENT